MYAILNFDFKYSEQPLYSVPHITTEKNASPRLNAIRITVRSMDLYSVRSAGALIKEVIITPLNFGG
jgi:hypothetical protein